jgi:hypothetical protein
MKNYKYVRQAQYERGFAPLLIILIIAALAIGGGVYYVKKNKTPTPAVSSNTQSSTTAITSDTSTTVNTKTNVKVNTKIDENVKKTTVTNNVTVNTCLPQTENLSFPTASRTADEIHMLSQAVAAAHSYIISKLGQKEYDCEVRFATVLRENAYNAADTNILVYFDFKPHKVPEANTQFLIVVDNKDDSIVQSSPNSTLYSIPNCNAQPQKCDITISFAKALALGKDAGMKSPNPNRYEYFYNTNYNTFVWKLHDNAPCPSLSVMVDATNGKILFQGMDACSLPPAPSR